MQNKDNHIYLIPV